MEAFWKQRGPRGAAFCSVVGVSGAHRHSLFYGLYLRSPVWRWRRWWRYMLSDRRCERCGRRVRLHGRRAATVHHRTYARLGHERREDVQLLCWGCHRRVDYWRHR